MKINAFCLMVLALAACSSMRHSVGLRGIDVGDEWMTLDGDTFHIGYRIGDSLLVVSRVSSAEREPYYLIKKEINGFYYVQTEADYIYSIDGTDDFVVLENRDVYDIKKKKIMFRTECNLDEGLSYLGAYDDKYLFANLDSLCFSDGKYIELQPDVYTYAIADKNEVRLTLGAQCIDVSPKQLYQSIGKQISKDADVEHFKKSYFIKPRKETELDDIGYDVDLDIPKGKDVANIAIRRWMMTQIRNDLFSMLEFNPEELAVPKCDNVEEMILWIDKYGDIWEKLLRHNFQNDDTLDVRVSSHITIRKIVDCDDYATYYFSSDPYFGGMHSLPRSYYATYDKRRNEFLTASNTIKNDARTNFIIATLQNLKKQYDEFYEKESNWDDFINTMRSYCCPSETENEITDEVSDETYNGLYWCDKVAEWNCNMSPNDISGFPLPHFAIIPESVVLTYHPYQIDCFAAGEYHAVIPLQYCAKYLRYEYNQDTGLVGLNRFIKMKEE